MFGSTADWMTRNLNRRVEVAFRIYDPGLQRELKEFLDSQWQDNVKARILDEQFSWKNIPEGASANIGDVRLALDGAFDVASAAPAPAATSRSKVGIETNQLLMMK